MTAFNINVDDFFHSTPPKGQALAQGSNKNAGPCPWILFRTKHSQVFYKRVIPKNSRESNCDGIHI